MAELLAAGGWVAAGSLAAYLREMLPNGYIVVADPIVCGCVLDAVVVGPKGLVALQTANGNGAPHAGQTTRDEEGLPAGAAALKAFVQDEFPALHPVFQHVVAERDPSADLPLWRERGADPMTTRSIAETLTSAEQPVDPALADQPVREDLAVALRDRQLTASQRAGSPFVFRSGSLLGTRTAAWTVREVVAHMDRHPQDGVYHLCNGTLEHWLKEQGAPHLAKLAQEAVLAAYNDRRGALEMFLVGTGLVSRPRLVTRPKRVDLGYVLDGASASGVLRIRRGRGRGYLFGHLAASVPWLRVEPKRFGGDAVDAVVVADTTSLLIGPEPYRAEVLVDSSASRVPSSVPVQLRVVSMPSRFSRYVLRPLAAILVAGIVGAFLGWLTLRAGNFAGMLPSVGRLPPGALPIALTAVLWGLLGGVRGAQQPPAWPIHYATYRWLRRSLKWGAALAAVALLAAWGWSQGGADVTAAPAFPYSLAALSGLIAAVLPATIGEIQSARALRDDSARTRRRRAFGSALRLGAGLVLLLALLATPRFLAPMIESADARAWVRSLQESVDAGWSRINAGADELTHRFYLRYFDRRAPEPASEGESSSLEPGLSLPGIRLP